MVPLLRSLRPAACPPVRIPGQAIALSPEDHEARGLDVDREQMEVSRRLPVDSSPDRGAVGVDPRLVLDGPRTSVQLEVALDTVAVTRTAVQHATVIAQEIQSLGRVPHHPEHQLAVDQIELARADP